MVTPIGNEFEINGDNSSMKQEFMIKINIIDEDQELIVEKNQNKIQIDNFDNLVFDNHESQLIKKKTF